MNFKGSNSFIGWTPYRDGILHIKEAEAIKQTAITVCLNLEATKRVLKNTPNVIIPADLLLKILEKSVKSTVLVIFFYHQRSFAALHKVKSLAASPLFRFSRMRFHFC
jgi:hypothetical protein